MRCTPIIIIVVTYLRFRSGRSVLTRIYRSQYIILLLWYCLNIINPASAWVNESQCVCVGRNCLCAPMRARWNDFCRWCRRLSTRWLYTSVHTNASILYRLLTYTRRLSCEGVWGRIIHMPVNTSLQVVLVLRIGNLWYGGYIGRLAVYICMYI